MQRQSIAAGLALCLATLPALATGPTVLHGADCLDPGTARNWVELDHNIILVDAGRKKYRMEIAPGCPTLTFSPELHFKGDPVSGRVCGYLADAVVTRESSCRIIRMELIDKAQYQQAVDEHRKTRKAKSPSSSKTP